MITTILSYFVAGMFYFVTPAVFLASLIWLAWENR